MSVVVVANTRRVFPRMDTVDSGFPGEATTNLVIDGCKSTHKFGEALADTLLQTIQRTRHRLPHQAVCIVSVRYRGPVKVQLCSTRVSLHRRSRRKSQQ